MKPFKRFIVLFSSALIVLLPKKIAHACGFWVYAGEYRFWLLQPDIVNEPDLTPFFFSAGYLYNGNQDAAAEPSVLKNMEEWQHITGSTVSIADIDTVLNYTNPTDFLNNTGLSNAKNSFYKWLLRADNRSFYSYMALSKKVEQMAINTDPWGEGKPLDRNIQTAINEAIRLDKNSSSGFLHLRTAYQLQRLYILNGEWQKSTKIYDSLIAPVKTNSWIKTAALYRTVDSGPMARQNYILSKVFDRGGYHRTACLVNFDSHSYKQTFSYAQNQHERNVVMAMKAFNYSGRALNDIETIYNTEPRYKEVSFLLLREINKLEDWLTTNKVTDFNPAVYGNERGYYKEYNAAINYNQDKLYAKRLFSFLQKAITENKRKDIGLLHLYAAHLAMLQNNNMEAQTHLSYAKSTGHIPKNVKTQIQINSFLLQLKMAKTFTPALENELMKIIQMPDKQLAIYDPATMKDQLILYTAKQVMAKKQLAKGILLLGKTKRVFGQLPIGSVKNIYQEMDEKATAKDFSEMVSIIEKKHKTSFEKFITGKELGGSESYNYYYDSMYNVVLDKNKILDCKATYYIKAGYLDSALQTLRLLPYNFWEQQPYARLIAGNPFYLNVNNAHVVTPDEGMTCNKKEVVEEMLLMMKKIKQEPSKAAEYNYQLANAFYNMTYYGKNWLMMKQWWSSGENYGETKRTAFNDLYFGCIRARNYYLKAMRGTTDKKLAALCCFMAGKCDENFKSYTWYAKQKGWDKKVYNQSPNPYLKQLGDETYYNEIVEECELYASYVKKYAGLDMQ